MAFLKRFARVILSLVGLALIALFIWYAGPFFAFADFHPFEPPIVRVVLIGLVVACWIGSILLKRLKAYRASEKLIASVVAQPMAPSRTSAETAKLRERFEEAVATLKDQRRSGHSLYDLPWYMIIGAPGSGKTTALVNSGLKFPLEKRFGREALTGVGGTRNCDWWFTDEAVFLDTAGRYTTQDSDAESDSASWTEFLSLLTKYRGRRPVNGVILTINARDLMVQTESALAGHVEAIHRRLQELTGALKIQVPVYLMVTKCDLVAGFTEYFEDLTQEERAQVWGVTFPYELTMDGGAPASFASEFEDLMVRLNELVFARVEDSRDQQRRAKIFAFPQQMAAIGEPLGRFITEVFASTRFERKVLLRGVYFTSGTQEGTPVDRLLGAIGRRFGVASDAVAAPSGAGKAYFVERLLTDVLIGESGLAGVNRRLEAKRTAAQLGAVAAMAALGILAVVLLTVSYVRNRAYLDSMTAESAELPRLPPVPLRGSIEALLPRFDAVHAIVESADRYRGGIPWSMRWGLYQGTNIGDAARDAYTRTLDQHLLPRVTDRMRARVVEYSNDPDRLYVYLKAYIMLGDGDPRHLDKKYLQTLTDAEWQARSSPEVAGRLSTHFQRLLDYRDTLRPTPYDAALVGAARNSIRQASLPRIMYGQIQRHYDGNPRTLNLSAASGLGADQVFARRSGRALAEPVPALYTKDVFKEVSGQDVSELVKQYAGEDWVWGDAGAAGTNTPNLKEKVLGFYEQDYISSWDETLKDIRIVPLATVSQSVDVLRTLTSPTSPLRGLLRIATDNTALVEGSSPLASAVTTGAVDAAKRRLSGITNSLDSLIKPLKDASGLSTQAPGALVSTHFQPIHLLLAGEQPGSARIDQLIGLMSQVEQQLRTVGPDVTNRTPGDALKSAEAVALWEKLKDEAAGLPPPIDTLVGEIASGSRGTVVEVATRDLEVLYSQHVLQQCRALVEGRYPFANSANDVTLADFGQVFGYGGLFDKFFTDQLASQVDTSQHPWRWKPGSVMPARRLLEVFQAAQLVRDRFFPAGAQMPSVDFTLVMSGLDAATRVFTLQIDDQYSDINTTDHRAGFVWRLHWPGKASAGEAVATFQDARAPTKARAYAGPWAWLRMIDATATSPGGASRVALTIADQYQHRVDVTVGSSSAANSPFAADDWRQFSCGN